MTNDRSNFDRTKFAIEAKENKELMTFIKSLTKEELARIKEVREFQTITKDTPTYNIAILCDTLRQNMRRLKLNIDKRIWSIDDINNNVHRLKIQQASGNITETMKGGIVMNDSELTSLIKHNEWLKEGEFYALYPLFGEIRAIAEHRDIAGNIIMKLSEFDEWVLATKEELKNYGFNLFGGLDD